MEEVFYILVQNIKADPIAQMFTKWIVILFFIGCLPVFIFLSSYIHKKVPILSKTPKKPIIFTISCIIAGGLGAFLSWFSWVFSLIFFTLFFIAVSPRLKKLTSLFVSPSLLTTMGILGTFVGIYMGLQEFNISNIDASIPKLLGGLKVAFTTSIIGIVGAILLKIIQSNIPNEEPDNNIIDIFNNINQVLQNHMEQSKTQRQKMLETSEKNIATQNKMIQYLYSKVSSLENTVKGSSESLNKPISEIKKEQ